MKLYLAYFARHSILHFAAMPRFLHHLLPISHYRARLYGRVMTALCGLLVLMLVSELALAQQQDDATSRHTVSGESFFSRQLDLFNWRYGLRYSYAGAEDGHMVELSNAFSSRFYLLDNEVQNIQDENTALLRAHFLPGGQSRYGLALESRSLRITNTNLKQDYGLAGLHYRRGEGVPLTVSGLAGFLQEERSQQQDSGLMLGLRAETQPYTIGELRLESTAYADYAHISPRELHTYRFNSRGLLDTDEFRMQAGLQLARNIRESYQADSFFNRDRSDFIESVRNDTTAISGVFQFPLSPSVGGELELRGLRNVRRISNQRLIQLQERGEPLFDTRVLRQELDVRFEARHQREQAMLSGGLMYTFATRNGRLENTRALADEDLLQQSQQLLNTNFEQQRIELFSDARLELAPENITRLNARISIFNYDTPEINQDDRDELYISGSVENRHQFSEALRGRVRLSGEGRHTVYLFSERSSQNNWRRSLRLAPVLNWRIAPWLYSSYDFLVRANYTVYDFDISGQQSNDQVSREFRAGTSIEARLAPQWSLNLAASRSELRVGRLLWESFSEIPTDTLITYDTRADISFQKGQLHTSIGLRYFLKLDFVPAATITAAPPDGETGAPLSRTAPGRQRSLQWGPTVEMRLPLYARNELFVSGWYQVQRVRQRLYTSYPEEFQEAFRRAEQVARITVYPNIEIRARFRF